MAKTSFKNEIMSVSHSISTIKTGIAHSHEGYEILYFIKGDIHYFIEGADYWLTSGGLLLIPKGVFHGIKDFGSKYYERYVLHLSREAADPQTRELLDRAFGGARYFTGASQFDIGAAIEDIFTAAETGIGGAADIALKALLIKIIAMQSKTEGSQPTVTVSRAVADVIEYINENYAEPLSLDTLSARFFISKHYLNKVFRKATGVTVYEYVIAKRLQGARALIQKGVPASSAAELTGFSDYSAFYKAHVKRYGASPKKNP